MRNKANSTRGEGNGKCPVEKELWWIVHSNRRGKTKPISWTGAGSQEAGGTNKPNFRALSFVRNKANFGAPVGWAPRAGRTNKPNSREWPIAQNKPNSRYVPWHGHLARESETWAGCPCQDSGSPEPNVQNKPNFGRRKGRVQ